MKNSIHNLSSMILLAILIYSSPVAAAPLSLSYLPKVNAKIQANEPVTIVGLGDSITTYYGNHNRNERYYSVPVDVSYYGVFANYLKKKFPNATFNVINKGIGGETADRGLKRVERDVLSQNPDLVFVMYGANDGRAGRDLSQYLQELTSIVQKIRATKADVILVAPTMSLQDISWLLPYRQGVLSLKNKIDGIVLDGTHAIWPTDEAIYNLGEVYDYLSLHFPPNGDDIHPAFAGHFQMGRRLWKQLNAISQKQQLSFSLTLDWHIPGPTLMHLKVHNTSDKPFNGNLQIFFPPKMPVINTVCEELDLPNHAQGNLRCLKLQKMQLAPSQQTEIQIQLQTPHASEFLAEPSPLLWLSRKAFCGIAVFTEAQNSVHYMAASPNDMIITLTGPKYVDNSQKAKLLVQISQTTPKPFTGKWQFINSKKNAEVNLSQTMQANYVSPFVLPTDQTKTATYRKAVTLQSTDGTIKSIDVKTIQCVPSVNAVKRNITIDKSLADWQGSTWQSFHAGTTEASFATARDEKNLYVAMRAQAPFLGSHKKIGWQTDGFELYFDTRSFESLGTAGPLFQLGFFPPNNPNSPLRILPGTGASKENTKAVHCSWWLTDQGYVIEAAIPISLFSQKGLTENQIIGFGIACNNVAAANQKKTQYQWAGTKANYNTPIHYPYLIWGNDQKRWRLNYFE